MTNHELHQIMWAELAATGESSKKSTLVNQAYRSDNCCYACAETGYDEEETGDIARECCPQCPIEWHVAREEDRCLCEIDGSPYRYWRDARTKEQRQYWARIIRDLPWHSRKDK